MQNEEALGLIETNSLPVMVEACDAAAKAANVRVVAVERIGCSFLTCFIRGDVAAVEAAVDAGVTSASRVGRVRAHRVIPRPHRMLLAVFPLEGPVTSGRGCCCG